MNDRYLLHGLIASFSVGLVDAVAVAQLADLLEETGQADLAYTYRWMWRHGKVPSLKAGVWYWFSPLLPPDPRATLTGCLPLCLYVCLDQGLPGALDDPIRAPCHRYLTRDGAVADLARALRLVREQVGLTDK